MKIPKSRQNSGSVLVAALVMAAVIGITLASYLVLIGDRNLITQRSQAWNSALPVLEAGIEEAFTHLHNDSNSPAANGWASLVVNGNTVYQKQRDFTNNNTYCIVTISNATTTEPVIYSRGFVPAPLATNYISRLVQVKATNPVVFSKAIAAQGPIALGANTTVDSFDSSNTNYSTTNGMYTASKRKANGGVYTDSNARPAITIGNGHIYGQAVTGPNGTVSTGSGGTVGDLTWTSGIQPGHTNNNMNVTFPDQSLPPGAAGGIPPSVNYTYQGTTYSSQVGTGNYKLDALTLKGGDTLVVTGDAILYVTGNISIGGNSSIYIAPGASLRLYGGGASTSFGGGGILNGTGLAANFSYYGLPSNTSVSFSGTANFIGTINAPEAAFTMGGTSDLMGAVIAKSFSSNGSGSLHYDEGLGGNGLLVMTSYLEL